MKDSYVRQTGIRIVLLGPPGAGKGTQGPPLATELSVTYLATGDMLRSEMATGSKLGSKVKTFYEAGDLVPDDIMIQLVVGRIVSNKTGVILDGFPRTLTQALALDAALKKAGSTIDVVINLDVEREELISRISNRIICRDCQRPFHRTYSPPKSEGACDDCGGEIMQRQDDQPNAIKNRLKVYDELTEPLINYYKQHGNLVRINGNRTADAIFKELRLVADKS